MLDIIIIGGGLSGLSSAVELCARGHKVLILEQHQHLGGRTYSFPDAKTGAFVDNGQHLMMGCYHATRRYLQLIGTDHLVDLQPSLKIDFLHPAQKKASFTCPRLPIPLNLLGGLFGFGAIPFNKRLEILRVAKELLHTSPVKEERLDQLTVNEWLVQHKQSDITRKYFWDVITIGALNNCPRYVSALMLFRVLRAAFLGRSENASLMIPRVDLSDLLVDPAIKFIQKRGGIIRTNAHVGKVIFKGQHIEFIQTTKGDRFEAKNYISAVPWYSAGKIFPFRNNNLDKYRSSPIIAIHLWLNGKVTDIDFAALLDTRIQWLFNKSHEAYEQKRVGEKLSDGVVENKKIKANQHLSLVISGANEFIDMSKGELVKIAMEDLCRVLPKAQTAEIYRSLVIKEKRATYSPSPGLESFRPNAGTEYNNLFVAGDWTATGYPATIEGAVLSGVKAADLIDNT